MTEQREIKAKIHKIPFPLYPVTLEYCSNAKAMDAKNKLSHHCMDFGGYCYHKQGSMTVSIHMPHEDGCVVLAGLAHEAFHAAMYVGDIVGLNPTLRDNESVAYLISWITETILKIVKKEFEESKPKEVKE